MTNKPKNITPNHLSLVKETNRLLLEKKSLTEEEMEYVEKLYWVIYDTTDTTEVMINDLKELSKWRNKNVGK